MKLKDKITIVTGGGQGLGRALCIGLAKYGAIVVAADINDAGAQETIAEITSNGGLGMALRLDVSDEGSVQSAYEAVMAAYGRVDVLVNNSGIAGPMGPTESVELKDWRTAFAVNVEGVFMMCKHAIPIMRNQNKGAILNVSSVCAKRPLLERTTYCATKASLIGMTRALALECGRWGIRVNSICPGAVEGPRQDRILMHAAKAAGITFEEAAASKKKASPLNTFVPPMSIADLVAFLCSDESAMMTGQDINISAGCWMS